MMQVSTDKGATWKPIPGATFQVRPDSPNLNALGEILVGTIASAPSVYYCTATGCTAATPSPLPGAQAAVTHFARGQGGVIFAINDASTVMHKSTDHGHTFTQVKGIDVGQAYACEFNQYGMMMGGEIGKLWATNNDGQSWTDWGLSHPSQRTSTDYNGNLWAVQTNPYTGTLMAAIGDPDVPGRGRMQRHLTSDGVGVWHGVTGMMGSAGEEVSNWVFYPNGSILAGVVVRSSGVGELYKSTDDGASWTEISAKIGVALTGSVRLHLGPSGCLYMTHVYGLLRNCSGY
jgi:hypothetical protein